jgi:hypothetical protein
MKAILTESKRLSASDAKRYNVGVVGFNVNRPRFLIRGPWCETTAREHAARLQDDLDHNRIKLDNHNEHRTNNCGM